MAKDIAIYIRELIDEKRIFELKKSTKRDRVAKRTYEILKEYTKDIDKIDIELKQKEQIFALATILLGSGEIVWITLKSIAKLLEIDLQDEDDNSTTQQAIIKSIAEDLFEHIAFRFKQDEFILDDWENHIEIDVGVKPYELLRDYNILDEYEREGEFINLKFSEEFERETKKIYNNILKYTPPSFEPMIVPPTPWNSIDDGGFIKNKGSSPKFDLYIMKTTTKRDKENLQARKDNFSPKLLEAINILQDTSWQINSRVLKDIERDIKSKSKERRDSLIELKRVKESRYREFKEIKNRYKIKKETLKEVKLSKEKIEEKLKSTLEELKLKEHNYKKALKEISRFKSQIDIKERIVQKADRYKKYEEIFFVWQIDFRGRAYPAQPLLNPQGDDISKALLHFATKKSLGENGERWFKIHGANLYGEDKVSFDDRVKWIEDNSDKILEIFNSREIFDNDFLQKADKPYSFLAFAYEYRDFISNPKEFKSSLPIAMDGSNNGFQHVTALLRDTKGAKKVNVLSTKNQTTPNDIYKDIADKTRELIDKDGFEENEIVAKIYNYINRDMTKKNVMTEVYGAGRDAKVGQIEDYIRSKLQKELKFDDNQVESLSKYLQKMIEKTMKSELSSSNRYKKWMKSISNIISEQNREIRWRTPIIELEVIEEEFKTKREKISTKYNNNKTFQIQIQIPTEDIDKREQNRGIAPNFIHSLDATHLFLTILKAKERGIESFATIHDSFGTHASDIDTLLEVIKESFIDMHKLDILSRLKRQIEEDYNIELKDIKYIDRENFDLEEIKESIYFFS